MRNTLLSWLPEDLRGARILDAGCGTGALAVEAARRGAEVRGDRHFADADRPGARARAAPSSGRVASTFTVGDMLDPAFGRFDYVVAMDSLIHYEGPDIARTLAGLAGAPAKRSSSPSRRAPQR